LKNKLSELSGFDFNQSPLRHLKNGFVERDGQLAQEIIAVFDLFNQENGE